MSVGRLAALWKGSYYCVASVVASLSVLVACVVPADQ